LSKDFLGLGLSPVFGAERDKKKKTKQNKKKKTKTKTKKKKTRLLPLRMWDGDLMPCLVLSVLPGEVSFEKKSTGFLGN